MMHWTRAMAGAVVAVALSGAVQLLAQEQKVVGAPRPGVKERVGAIERLLEMRTDDSIKKFIDEQLSPALRSSKSAEQWTSDLKQIRQLYRGFGSVRIAPSAEGGIAISFGGSHGADTPLLLDIDTNPPHLITGLKIGTKGATPPKPTEGPKLELTWDNLRDKLKAEEADGFTGSVLVVRDGSVLLHEGYGLADRTKKIPNRPETVFAIGSTPIDFTQGAILKLEEMGKLKTSDPITKHLPDVPDDKKSMTIDDLMTGRSGLPNFLGRPGDPDPDNFYIDRAEALKRILGSDLLFQPGSEHEHSHAAFGVLAAIVEVVSGDTYTGFLDKNMFGPAGMTNTRHYEEIKAKDEDVAIGYGGKESAAVNSPKNWGKTSWLVLGSGGMVSTAGDLYRWNQAVRQNKILSSDAAKKYWNVGSGSFVGGSMHGFYTSYTTGPDTMFFLCTNDIGREEKTERLTAALNALVNQPKYRMGVSLKFGSHEGVMVESVVPGSPADRAGIKVGDRLYSINGENLGPHSDPSVTRTHTATGKPVELVIKRGEETLTITLTPVRG